MAPAKVEASSSPARFAIFASGRGSNAVALMDAFQSKFIPAALGLVLSNNPDAPVLTRAAERGFASECVPHRGLTREAHEEKLLAVLHAHAVEHVLLAGYLRILSPHFLRGFGGSVLNIHPSLLPDFPGLHAAQRQWQAKRAVVGATVHFVDDGVDTGKVLLQGSLVAHGDETQTELEERLLTEVEHVIYPRAVRLFLDRLSHHG